MSVIDRPLALVVLLALACALAPAANAQLTGPGLTWSGTSGASAGTFHGTCLPAAVSITAGETVTVTVWGDVFAPYALLAGTTATSCTPYPNVTNALVLDLPVILASSGLLTLVTPCLACPPGLIQLSATLPAGLPLGTTFAVQAVSYGNGIPGFTSAIVATVI